MSLNDLLTVVNSDPRSTLDDYMTALFVVQGLMTIGKDAVSSNNVLFERLIKGSDSNVKLISDPILIAYFLEGASDLGKLSDAVNFLHSDSILGEDIVDFSALTSNIDAIKAFAKAINHKTILKLNEDLSLGKTIYNKFSSNFTNFKCNGGSKSYPKTAPGLICRVTHQDSVSGRNGYLYLNGDIVLTMTDSNANKYTCSKFNAIDETYAKSDDFVTLTVYYLDLN